MRQVDLQRASLYRANLQGVWLALSHLDGASFEAARLQGATLAQTFATGASFDFAELQGVSFDGAQLQDATFNYTKLQGASLNYANMQGASFVGAQLQGSSLDGAQLQGASFEKAELMGASLAGAFVWRADIRQANTAFVHVETSESAPKMMCPNSNVICDALTNIRELETQLKRAFPDTSQREERLLRLQQRLDPKQLLDGEIDMAKRWAYLQTVPTSSELHDTERASAWLEAGCNESGAPYVATAMSSELERDGNYIFLNPRMLQLASEFLGARCIGAQGMSDATKGKLKKVRDYAAEHLQRRTQAGQRR